MSIKRDLQRLVERLRAVEPCPRCGIAKADRKPPILMNHPGIIALRNCPECGGGLSMHFTMIIGQDPPTVTDEEADSAAREFFAQGMTPAGGWTFRPQVMEAMGRLGFAESL